MEDDLPFSSILTDFLEPLFHHAIYLRHVYDPVYFEKTVTFEVETWRCNHPKVVSYLQTILEAIRHNIDTLQTVRLCFLVDEHITDELEIAVAPTKVDETAAVWLLNWFRETLLNLENSLENLQPATMFEVKLVMIGQMVDVKNEWVFSEGEVVLQEVKSVSSKLLGAKLIVKR